MRNEDTAVYVISVAAELAGMHPQTLRIYERRGLLRPARTQGGNRRYSDADIARLRRIAELASSGMNLEGIRHVMSLEAEVAHLREQVEHLRIALAEAAVLIEGRRSAELVPLRQAMAIFADRAGMFGTSPRK
ncbi:MAG: heat shock protein transcriptional repressor HspR [Ilumatobacteraceae bacterium]|jgi:MerR family transcriptional regulator/heat shock protein HspR